MANNPNLYNAILAGAAGGNQQRWLTDNNASDYSGFEDAIGALATAIDDAIDPIEGDANVAQCALMQSIVQGVFSDRYVQSTAQAFYQSIVGPIVAIWSQVNSALQPGGSGSAGMSTLVYVDPASTVPAESQSGSAINPYGTLQQAIDRLVEEEGGTAILADGDYTDEGASSLATQANELYTFVSYGGALNIGIITITGTALVDFQGFKGLAGVERAVIATTQFKNCEITGDINTTGDLEFNNVSIVGNITCRNITAKNGCRYQGDLSCTSVATFTDSEYPVGNITDIVSNLNFVRCTNMGCNISITGALSFEQSELITDGLATVDCGDYTSVDSQIAANVTAAGFATLDHKSYEFLYRNGTLEADTIGISDLQPVDSEIGWDASAPLVIEVLPLGHAPGLYEVNLCGVVRTAAGAGTVARTVTTTPSPGAGSKTMTFAGIAITSAIFIPFTPAQVFSDGTAAISVTLTPAGIAGNPVLDIYSSATLLGVTP